MNSFLQSDRAVSHNRDPVPALNSNSGLDLNPDFAFESIPMKFTEEATWITIQALSSAQHAMRYVAHLSGTNNYITVRNVVFNVLRWVTVLVF
ncbi:hypothetical protein EVAR_8103_1 [Eumeta japonica]|uniref:Uncharacterized protein n=1 Tax=Eumeta variegata TaxID=151549 RepID=A0A4C1TSP4_EUMVA|nr:hypothetical protein EVAR_8103_1 [Eumeta japonica]